MTLEDLFDSGETLEGVDILSVIAEKLLASAGFLTSITFTHRAPLLQ